jgi:pseudomonalisin
MNRFLTLSLLSLPVLLGLVLIGTGAQAQGGLAGLQPMAQANRVAAHPDLAAQTQLTGHLPGWVNGGNQVPSQRVDVSAPMHVSILMRRDPAVQAAFEQFLTDQQTPGSPLYHQWLTPQQVGTLFGPTANDVAAVTSWVAAQGLKVEAIAPSQIIVEVSGTTAAVGNAFRTSFGYFNLGGEAHLSAISEPSIPSALAPVIQSIHGLTDVPLHPLSFLSKPIHKATAAGTEPSPLLTTTSGTHYLTPNDFAAVYDVNSVYTGGNKGAMIGSKAGHIAIIGRSRVAATDISEFATNVGIASYNLNTIIPPTGVDPGAVCTFANANTCSTAGDQGEQTLDVDRVIGTAPGVQADLVVATNASGGIYLAASYNVNTLLDPVMTISYGACEANAGSNNVNLWDTLFSTGAAEGISSFVSSGDSGADACSAAFTPTTTTLSPSINYICASSYDTCVGGTEFADTVNPSLYWSATNSTGLESALSYIPEGAWNEPGTTAGSYSPTATGGGASQYIAKPSWQTGVGVPADGKRDTPDVAYPAAGHDGFYACLDYALGEYTNQGINAADNCTTAGGGYFFGFSGTSAAAPSMAGVAALLNTRQGEAQGNLNPMLYKLAATASVFHDITPASSGVANCVITTPSMCNNSTPGASADATAVAGGVQGFALTTGYDQATGLGSIDVGVLLSSVAAITLSQPAALSFTSGATTGNTATTTLSSLNGFAGTVALTCSITTSSAAFPPTCAASPTSTTLAAGGTTAVTITIGSTVAQDKTGAPQQAGLSGWNVGVGVLLAGLFGVATLRRRRFAPLAAVMLLTLGLSALAGCGGSSTPAAAAPKRSSAGSYVVTVTAVGTSTSGSSATTTTLNVTIN